GDEVVFAVRDSGIGIPPEMLAHIFDLFTQVDRSLDRSQGGLGIGLTLVRRLVELHGGTVRATSAGLQQGSEFTVRLPTARSVLLDIGLPEMDGYEIARRIHAEERFGRPALIAVTGYGQDGDRARTREAGFDHHLVKPVDPEILPGLIASLLTGCAMTVA